MTPESSPYSDQYRPRFSNPLHYGSTPDNSGVYYFTTDTLINDVPLTDTIHHTAVKWHEMEHRWAVLRDITYGLFTSLRRIIGTSHILTAALINSASNTTPPEMRPRIAKDVLVRRWTLLEHLLDILWRRLTPAVELDTVWMKWPREVPEIYQLSREHPLRPDTYVYSMLDRIAETFQIDAVNVYRCWARLLSIPDTDARSDFFWFVVMLDTTYSLWAIGAQQPAQDESMLEYISMFVPEADNVLKPIYEGKSFEEGRKGLSVQLHNMVTMLIDEVVEGLHPAWLDYGQLAPAVGEMLRAGAAHVSSAWYGGKTALTDEEIEMERARDPNRTDALDKMLSSPLLRYDRNIDGRYVVTVNDQLLEVAHNSAKFRMMIAPFGEKWWQVLLAVEAWRISIKEDCEVKCPFVMTEVRSNEALKGCASDCVIGAVIQKPEWRCSR